MMSEPPHVSRPAGRPKRVIARFPAILVVFTAALATLYHLTPRGAQTPEISRERSDASPPEKAQQTELVQTDRAPEAAPDKPERAKASNLRERSSNNWKVPEAELRQIVELAPPPPPQETSLLPRGVPKPPVTAQSLLLADSPHGVRVFHSNGAEVECSVSPERGPAGHTVVFRLADVADGQYEIYFGSQPREETGSDLSHDHRGGITLSVFAVSGQQANDARRLEPLVELLKEAQPVGASMRRRQVDDCTNPLGRSNNYVAVYEGFLDCREAGVYSFGIDADDRAFLLLNGRRSLEGGAPGRLPNTPFPQRTAKRLARGLHAVTLYHVQGDGALRSRLAWRPPGAARMAIIPPSSFVEHYPAQMVTLEKRDSDRVETCFEPVLGRRLIINRSVPVCVWTLEPCGAALEGTPHWAWSEDGRDLAGDDALKLFVAGEVPRIAGRQSRLIQLALESDSGTTASYSRRIGCLPSDPPEDEAIDLRLEIVAAPAFVYTHEPYEVNLIAVNESKENVELEMIEYRYGKRGEAPASEKLGVFPLPPVGPEDSDLVAARMNRVSRRFTPDEMNGLSRLVYALGFEGAPAISLELTFYSSRDSRLPSLYAEMGSIYLAADSDARINRYAPRDRAVLVLPYDTEAHRRQWQFLRNLSSSTTATADTVLLFGDPLRSPGARRGDGLVPLIRQELESHGTRLHSVVPEGDTYPILAAVAAADSAFRSTAWRGIYISLGHEDVRMGTPIDDFERGLDFIIDRARIHAPGARIVVIGPPPEFERETTSSRYARGARKICQQHQVDFVDVHELVQKMDDPSSAYKDEGRGDAAHFVYPVGNAMEMIAEAVLAK